jgi:hypothetical protein
VVLRALCRTALLVGRRLPALVEVAVRGEKGWPFAAGADVVLRDDGDDGAGRPTGCAAS